MVTIGRRVQEAIDHMAKSEYELALTPTCIAIDCTAKLHYGKRRHSSKDYKRFLQEHFAIIQFVGFPGLMVNELIIPLEFEGISQSPITLDTFIYHYIRCNLIHDIGLTERVVFNDRVVFGVIDNKLYLSSKLIWGPLATVILSPSNKGESVPEFYWFGIDEFRYFINDLWGRRDIAERIMRMKLGPNISLNTDAHRRQTTPPAVAG